MPAACSMKQRPPPIEAGDVLARLYQILYQKETTAGKKMPAGVLSAISFRRARRQELRRQSHETVGAPGQVAT